MTGSGASAILFALIGGITLWMILWLLTSLYFAIEAIVLDGQPVIRSVIQSTQMVRLQSLPTVGLAITINLLMLGFRAVWGMIGQNPVGAVLAIAGNAYLGVGLILGIFVYYQDRRRQYDALVAQAKSQKQLTETDEGLRWRPLAEQTNRPNHYTADDIQVLEGLEAVRRRPGMYIGGTDVKALHHMVNEVVDNSIDEAMAGYCDRISIVIHPDGSVTVEDWGRGIPVDMHKQAGKSALEVVMTKLHAGGKFGSGAYKVSGGLHGVGVSAVNALSDWLVVEVRVGGQVYSQRYHRGVPQEDVKVIGKVTDGATGTRTTFMPDDDDLRGDKFPLRHPGATLPRDGLPESRPDHRVHRRTHR